MRLSTTIVLTVALLAVTATGSSAAQLIYRPTNPSFGGDPQNGNWLLSQASAQDKAAAGSSSPGFSIDFPDFGGVTQPAADPVTVPQVDPVTGATN